MRWPWRQQHQVDDDNLLEPSGEDDERFSGVLLTEGREELDRADGKAATLLSAAGVAAGILLAGAVAGNWSPNDIDYDRARIAFWVGIALASAGIVLLAWAVLPKTRNPGEKEQVRYFGDVVRYRSRRPYLRPKNREKRDQADKAQFRAAVARASGSQLDRTLDQVWAISAIVVRKYRRIRWGLLFHLAAGVVCVGALVINAAR